MMSKFEAGDKVKRTKGDWFDCKVGSIRTVKNCDSLVVTLIGDNEGYTYLAENFELVEDMVCPPSEQQIITAWLDKLAYVLSRDDTVSDYLDLRVAGLTLESDIVNIVGSADIYQYVENTYDQLKSQEIQKKSQKLLEQKEQLAKQLADVEKELESLK
jgi:hypothetical protein